MRAVRRWGMLIWQMRGFVAALLALLLGWRAQAIYDQRDLAGFAWYLLAASIFILGTLFTYRQTDFFRRGSYQPTEAAASPNLEPTITTLRTRIKRTPAPQDSTPETTLPVRHKPPTQPAEAPPNLQSAISNLQSEGLQSAISNLQSDGLQSPAVRRIRYTADLDEIITPLVRPSLGQKLTRQNLKSKINNLKSQRSRWLGLIAIIVGGVGLLLHRLNPLDPIALSLWAASLVIFALACARQRNGLWPLSAPNPDELTPREDEGQVLRPAEPAPNHRTEYIILAIIIILALFIRGYGLTYSHIAIHSDESEISLIAKALLHGNFAAAPPLTTADWFYFPSGTMWTMVPAMALFGDDNTTAIHVTSVIFSVLDIFAIFLLVRLLFGVRPALFAAGFMTAAPPLLHFALYPSGTEQVQFFWAIGLYFFFKGLRSKRYLDFVWAGFAMAASLHFYPSSRSIFVLIAVMIGFLIITRWKFLSNYWRHLGVFAVAVWLFAAPIAVYTFEHREVLFKRLNDVSIFSPIGSSIAFATWHLGYPPDTPTINPATVLSHASYWANLLKEQAGHTYLALHYYDDGTYFYQTGKPFMPPILGIFTALGLAYCLWRWRDPRYFMLTIWFWLGLFMSSVITINPPELLRMSGVVQAFYIFPAIFLHKFIYEAERAIAIWQAHPRRVAAPPARLHLRPSRTLGFAAPGITIRPLSRASTSAQTTTHNSQFTIHNFKPSRRLFVLAILLIAYLTMDGARAYYDIFRDGRQQWADMTIEAYYLRDAQEHYHAYYVSGPGLGINFVNIRFLAPHLSGEDVSHPADILPFSQKIYTDALFLFTPERFNEVSVVSQIYPNAITQIIPYIDGQTFRQTAIVRASYANSLHGVRAGYFSGGNFYQLGSLQTVRPETSPGLDTDEARPSGLQYPAVGVWEGAFFAEREAEYTLKVSGGAGGYLSMDDKTYLRYPATQAGSNATVALQRGWHPFSLRVTLPDAKASVQMLAYPSGDEEKSIPFEHLYPATLRQFNAPLGTAGAPQPPPSITNIQLDPVQTFPAELNNNFPQAIAVDPQGNAYVGQNQPPHVYKFDKDGNRVADWDVLPQKQGEDTPNLSDLTTDAQGNIYVQDSSTKNIEVYNADGKLVSHRNVNNKFAAFGPGGLTSDKQGNLYIINTGGSNIFKVSPADTMLKEIGGGIDFPNLGDRPDPRRTDQPIDGVVGSDGSFYVADLKSRIIKYAASGQYVREWRIPNLHGDKGAMHMAVSGNRVFVSDSGGLIYMLNTDTANLTSFGSLGDAPGKFDNPAGLATDAQGRLYVADRNNRRVQVFDFTGK